MPKIDEKPSIGILDKIISESSKNNKLLVKRKSSKNDHQDMIVLSQSSAVEPVPKRVKREESMLVATV